MHDDLWNGRGPIGTSAPPLPEVTDRATWQAQLDDLLVREKALHTREGDAIAAARRQLPMVEVDSSIPVTGEHGQVPLLEVFEGRRRSLISSNFDARITFDPARARLARYRPRPHQRPELPGQPPRAPRPRRLRALVDYTVIDPLFVLPDTCTFDDPARRPAGPGARALPGPFVPPIRAVLRIAGGRHRDG